MTEAYYWATRTLYYGIYVILVAAFAVFMVRGDWASAFYSALTLLLVAAPVLLKKRYDFYLPFEIELAVILFVFLAIFVGEVQSFYQRFPLWDAILHFQSGLLLGVVGLLAIYLLNERSTKKLNLAPGFIAFFAFNFSLALGAVWEIFEFALDSWFGMTMQESGLPDTMGDLIVNAIGALIVVTVSYIWMRQSLRLPFTRKRL